MTATRLLIVPDGVLVNDDTIDREIAVLVEGDRIAALLSKRDAVATATDARRVNLAGATLLPGFIDLHTYLSIDPDLANPMGQIHDPDLATRAWRAARFLERDLLSGVTTARVMGEGGGLDFRARAATDAGSLAGPRLYASGVPVTPSNGHQAGPRGFDGVDGVRRGVRENVANGADWIKLVVTGGVNGKGPGATTATYTRTEIRAAIHEAARAGKPVAAAAHGGPAVRIAAEEGVSTIEHASLFGPEEVEAVIAHGTHVVLTLSRFFHPDGIARSARGDAAVTAALERACAAMRNTLPAAIRSGMKVVLGTDNMHGLMAADIAYLGSLGATPAKAIAAATRLPANLLGRTDLGRLAVGATADIVAVGGDPLADLGALHDVRLVLKSGVPHGQRPDASS